MDRRTCSTRRFNTFDVLTTVNISSTDNNTACRKSNRILCVLLDVRMPIYTFIYWTRVPGRKAAPNLIFGDVN